MRPKRGVITTAAAAFPPSRLQLLILTSRLTDHHCTATAGSVWLAAGAAHVVPAASPSHSEQPLYEQMMSKCRSAAAARLLLSTLSTLVLPAAWAVTQPEFDCPARQLAFEQASKLMADGPLAAGLKDVHDALQLSAACNATFDAPPAQRPEQQQQQQRWPSDVDGSALLATLHVATTGDDTGADGSAAKPYATLRAARDAARARNDGPGGLVVGTIAISAGRYELTETLTLGAEKAHFFGASFTIVLPRQARDKHRES
jgi:hypothetical protein